MFGRRKKPPPAESPGGESCGIEVSEEGLEVECSEGSLEPERHRLLQAWRRSEQRVMRTWQAWLAATADDQAERYGAYLGALAEEEAAAIAVQCAGRPAFEPACEAAPDVAESPPR